MPRFASSTLGLGTMVAGLCVTLALGALAAPTVFQQKPLATFLNENNWIALAIPDSKMRPGSVIKVKNLNNFVEVQWLGDIRKCGIGDKQLGVVRGKYPAMGVSETFAVKASIAAGLMSLFHISAEADKLGGAVLKIDDAGGDAIDFVAFTIWAAKQGKRLNAACADLLSQDDIYLVTEAFRISKGTYQLVDKNGAKIGLSASVPGRSAEGGLEGSINTSGELEIAGDFYFGVRRAKQISPNTFQTLGNSQEVPDADQLLLQAQ